MPTPDAAPTRSGPAWSRARIVRGLLFFLIATAIGFAYLAHRGTLDGGLAALGRMRAWALAVGVLQVVLDQVLGGMRIACCLRAVNRRA